MNKKTLLVFLFSTFPLLVFAHGGPPIGLLLFVIIYLLFGGYVVGPFESKLLIKRHSNLKTNEYKIVNINYFSSLIFVVCLFFVYGPLMNYFENRWMIISLFSFTLVVILQSVLKTVLFRKFAFNEKIIFIILFKEIILITSIVDLVLCFLVYLTFI